MRQKAGAAVDKAVWVDDCLKKAQKEALQRASKEEASRLAVRWAEQAEARRGAGEAGPQPGGAEGTSPDAATGSLFELANPIGLFLSTVPAGSSGDPEREGANAGFGFGVI